MADGKLQVWDGKLLAVGGKLAAAEACCCGGICECCSTNPARRYRCTSSGPLVCGYGPWEIDILEGYCGAAETIPGPGGPYCVWIYQELAFTTQAYPLYGFPGTNCKIFAHFHGYGDYGEEIGWIWITEEGSPWDCANLNIDVPLISAPEYYLTVEAL